jgi:hypothetical protein
MVFLRSSFVALALLGAAFFVKAQPLDTPPQLPAAASTTAPAKAEPAKADAAKAMPARDENADKRGTIIEDEALADLPPVRPTSPETRIDQRRQGNRIVELTVTPAGSTRSYTIVNREGQRPLGADELSAGLSTPRFLRFDF